MYLEAPPADGAMTAEGARHRASSGPENEQCLSRCVEANAAYSAFIAQQ
jgi:hypothetical protein